MSIELVTVGTELLLGFTVDTNSAFIGQHLAAIGAPIVRRTSVHDTPDAIRDAVDAALTRTGFVLTTGGLGPTRDDMTKHVVAELLGMPLAFDEAIWAELVARWKRLGRELVASNRSQAMVPQGGTVLPNKWGSAPGLWLESPRGVVIMLPGVPFEMKMLMEHEVLPRLVARGGAKAVRSRTLRTGGIGESALAEKIADIEDAIAPLTLAYLPDVASVDLRLTSWDLPVAEADARIADAIARLRERIGGYAWGEGTDDLAATLLDRLRTLGKRVAVGESCTGGMIAARLTDAAGASDVMLGGVASYANSAKRDLLDVPAELIDAHGAVSREVAEAMAVGAARRFGADAAIGVTGIAGPGGGSDEKPVGTVWIATVVDGVVECHRALYPGVRHEIRARATQGALFALWRRLGA